MSGIRGESLRVICVAAFLSMAAIPLGAGAAAL